MTFSEFKKSVSKIEKIELPGEEAHLKMAPHFRRQELKALDVSKKNPRNAGVMALFYPNTQGETMFVLILRKTYKGVHSAQVGFPGGGVEPFDKDLQATAVRETYEEIGVDPEAIQVLKKLSRLYIPPSNFWVQPFLGIVEYLPTFKKQESEVEEIIQISVEDFLDDTNIVEQKLPTTFTKEEHVRMPVFLLNNHIVWGATAMMLSEIRLILSKLC